MDYSKCLQYFWNLIPGATPADKVKLLVAICSALGLLWAFFRWMRGRDIGTRLGHIEDNTRNAATVADIANLTHDLLNKLAAIEGRLVGAPNDEQVVTIHACASIMEASDTVTSSGTVAWKQQGESSLAKDLAAAIDTLAAGGLTSALELAAQGDTTAAHDALVMLIAELERARSNTAKGEAALYRQLGALTFLNDIHEAIRHYAKACELDPNNSDGWNQLGQLQLRGGEWNAAKVSYENVLTLGTASGDKKWIAEGKSRLGFVHYKLGNFDRAEQMNREALKLDEESGNLAGVADRLNRLGHIYRKRNDPVRAKEMYTEALNLNEKLGCKRGMGINCGNLGHMYFESDDLSHAEEMYTKALCICEEKEIDNKEGAANQYNNLGNVYSTRGDLPRAEEMYAKALKLSSNHGFKEVMANTHSSLGSLYKKKDDIVAACKHWRKSCTLFSELGATHMVEKVKDWLREANCPGE